MILNHLYTAYIKESIWISEVNFQSEWLAGIQDITSCFFSLEKHYLLSQLQLHLTGTILINKLIMQMVEALNWGQLLLGQSFQREARLSVPPP